MAERSNPLVLHSVGPGLKAALLIHFFCGNKMVTNIFREECGLVLLECTGRWRHPAEAG